MLVGAVLGALVLFVVNLSLAGAVVVTLLVAAYELLVYRIAANVGGRSAVGAGPV
jgi:hypothetical protein